MSRVPPECFDAEGNYVPSQDLRPLGVKARKLARTDLLPPDSLWEVAEILGWGAANRGDTERNWESGLVSSEPVGGALRHIFQWMAGEENDAETGRSHLSHAVCNLLFARSLQMRGQLIDTRGPGLGPLRTEVVDPAPTA